MNVSVKIPQSIINALLAFDDAVAEHEKVRFRDPDNKEKIKETFKTCKDLLADLDRARERWTDRHIAEFYRP